MVNNKYHRRPTKHYKIPKKYFFGWNNIKWFIREFGKIYSGQKSYFSKKRLESGISFFIGQFGMIVFFVLTYNTLSMSDFIMWASLEFAVGGYITHQIQRQKRYYINNYEFDGEDDYEYDQYDRYNRSNYRGYDYPNNEYESDENTSDSNNSTDYPI